MYRYLLVALCLLLVGCIGTLSTQGQNFNPSKVHLVDKLNGSYLFRGNEPLTGKGKDRRFAHAELISEINQRLKQEGYKQLEASDFEIVDISLLNRVADDHDLKIEKAFFKKNPDMGRFINWPLFYVDELIPAKQSERNEIVGLLPGNKLVRFLEKGVMKLLINQNRKTYKHVVKLKQLLEEASENRNDGKVTIFYIHCNAGCDRTGEFITAYRMTNNKLSCSEAAKKNTAECGRPQNYYSVNGTYWYCKYLKSLDSDYVCDCPETL